MRVKLTNGRTMLIDRADYDYVSQFTWRQNQNGYADRNEYISHENGRRIQKMIVLHRYLMGNPTQEVDHINGNRLDNRRANLRVCTRQENTMNRKKRKNCSSSYKGVFWHHGKQIWVAKVQGKQIGTFREEVDAATAYNIVAQQRYGEFARLN